jgi:hypothetical protein
MILASGGMKVVTALSKVVFPEAVSPDTKTFIPLPMTNER